MFPPHYGPTSNLTHQVTITATGVWTSVTVQVLESSFMQQIFLSASQSKTIHLLPSVGMISDRSSHLLSVTSVWPVTVIASFCTPTGCDHSLLHDVSSWGTHYYPITPHIPNKNVVSQMVITSSDHETSVDIFLSGEVLFKSNVHPRGSVLNVHLGALQSVYIQSNSSLSGSELNSQEAVGVVVGFTCYKDTVGHCLYGFAELKPVSHWSFDYVVPPLVNTEMSYSFLLAMAAINSPLEVTTSTRQTNMSLVGGVMTVIPVDTSDKIQITSDSPLQLVYFRHYSEQRPSTLTVLPSVDDICRTEHMFDSGDMSEQQDNSSSTGDLKSGVKVSQRPNFAQIPENTESSSLHTDTDVGHYLSVIDRQLYPAACENAAASCAEVHCGPKEECSMEDGKPVCSLQTKICSAWGDSYYRTFNGRDLVLQGNCNYTLVQTTCPGLNASTPLQINIARAYLNSATDSTIHSVQIRILGFNISMVKEDKNHVRINGQKRNLPLTLGDGSLYFHQSGSSVVLETTFGLTLHYDWRHHFQVEVGPELYGKLCGLCGNANHSSSDGSIASNHTDGDQTVDLTLPWVVNSDAGSCIENCGGAGASCPVCTQSQTKSFSGTKGHSFMTGCTLLQWRGGPFANCHSYIDPEPFVRSCVNNLCIDNAATSVCKILTAYATVCQRLGARVHNWRTMAECSMACPLNSHYEICGSACPATCADPDTHRNCTLACVESCQCNRGFLLSGGKCVPHSKCGCLHQGSYYLPKEKFWADEQCQEKCVCQPNSKTVMCAQSQCRDGTMCKVLNGVLDCHVDGPGLCIAKGDPHYTTFDGRNFNVYGNCTYLLTSHCPSWGELEDFRVEVQNQIRDTSNDTFRRVKMVVSGYSIEMSNDWTNRVMVNGLLLRLPSVLSRGKVRLYMTGLSTCIETDFGIIVTYSSDVLTVQMQRIFSGHLCGLCGNFNGNPEDDVIPDDESDISQAVRHWKISGEHECVDVPIDATGCISQDMSLYQGKDFCGRLLDTEGAFQSCHKTVDPQDFYENCVHDLCYNNQTTLCQILSSYVAVCQEMGAMVDEWRDSNFCNLTCPSNSEYHLCSTRMSDCVENPSPLTVKCKEGCFCKPEFFNSAGKCVPNSECGCVHDGVYHEVHEEFYPDDSYDKHSPNGSLASDVSIFASPWMLSPSGTNCSQECELCSVCNSSKATEFASDNFCGMLLAPAGSFSGCHSTVDPEPFFKNCVNDLCMSNGNEEIFCHSLSEYTFACQEAGAEVKPWRALLCPENSHYNICVSACPESCGILSDIPCPWACDEGCQCDSGYMQSGNGCIKAEECGCFYHGQYYEIGERSWAEGCSEHCHCSATATMCCEPASCPEGESCTLNNTWGCARKAIPCPQNSHFESCGTACPATCEAPLGPNVCTLACVETCQCDPGFVLDDDICVPLSQCGCNHNSYHYHRNQTFWADERCTEKCVCDPRTHRTQCHVDSCGPDESCTLENGVRSCISHPQQTCMYSGHHIVTFDQHDYDLHGTCQYQLLGMCGNKQGIHAIQVHVQTDGHLESALHVLVNVSGVLVELNSKNMERLEVDGVIKNMPYHLGPTALASSLGMHTYIYTDVGFEFSLSTEGVVTIRLSSKYANATCGLCGNFNSDPADDLTASGAEEHLSPEQFGKAWRTGQNPWCVDGCLGGSCPKCSTERLALFSDPEACGKILEVNGPFRHCHGKVNPSSFYKRCVSDLCLHGGLQPALCHSLAVYTAVCLSHRATVYAWRSPGFCYSPCLSSTSYNMSAASVHLCLGLQNNTVEMPPNTGENCLCEAGLVHSGSQCVSAENCGCFHQGEYLQAGQEVSTCEKSCRCNAGGRMTCRNIFCGKDEECKLLRGVQGCYPKPKLARCSVDGSQYTTFDGRAFEFHGSCNYTLVQTCALKKLDVEPVFIAAKQNHSKGRQIYLQVNKMYFEISAAFPGNILVNGVNENLPFSQSNFTVHQKNGWITVKTPQSVELISDLKNHILVKIPNIYHQTTCGLCGNYNDNPSDDLQLPDGSVISEPEVFGPSWKLFDNKTSCSDVCDGTCQRCQSPMPEYTSDLYCGLLTHPKGLFSSCHHLVSPQKFYSLCMKNLCIAQGQHWALCDALWDYEAACKEAGAMVDLWTNTTSCAHQCPQFSHYSQCANVCSLLCPEISQGVQCPRDCEEGCQCNTGTLYDGNACVPAEQCGCIQDGRRFKAAESQLLHNCAVNCTCGPPLVCEQYSCPPLHKCGVLDGVMGCHEDEQTSDPCEGRCDEKEKCYLSNGVPVCESLRGLCWTWGGQHYHTFDWLNYNFEGTCTYLLAASKGEASGLTPFSVSKKNLCNSSSAAPSTEVVTVQAYGFSIKLGGEKGSVNINGQSTYVPVNLLQGKIQVSDKEGKAQLKTDFGLHIVFGGNSTVVVTLSPTYKGQVYGLCGNFNGDHQDEMAVTKPSSPPTNSSVEFAQAYRLSDGDDTCCTGCKREPRVTFPADPVSEVAASHRRLCEVLKDKRGPMAYCHSLVAPESFYESCLSDLMQNGTLQAVLDQAISSYSIVCEASSDDYRSEVTADVRCPPNSYYRTCGTACPPSCEYNTTVCTKACVMGCFCDPGFITSQTGCVRPHQCGCTESTGKYHSLNSTYWTPDNCGELCTCGPATGEVHCQPDHCPRGMVCKQLHRKKMCQPEKPMNCTMVTGLHFTSFDGHHFDYRDSCSYSLVQTKSNITELTPFTITISDAICHKRLFYSLNLTLSIYDMEVVVGKHDPGKVFVDGLHEPLPYSHPTGHVNAYRTPSSLVIHTDVGLQVVVYNTGTLMVILSRSYASSVSGLCGNANSDPEDDLMMPNEEQAQNKLEFVHSWRSRGAEACRDDCIFRLKHCPVEAQKLFEGSDFCGVLLNELGPFADCSSVLSPKHYFHSCVEDVCSYSGHYSALCSSIASYAAACQAAQLPVRHWRSDTFCRMSCPKNSHYELCGPRCPVVCQGLSSPANCNGGCEEGCQCDPGYVLSDGQCVLVSDCGCMHEGHHHPAGPFFSKKSCQKCNCERGRVTCIPIGDCLVEEGLALQYGVCQVFAGFGYITFDGVILPHHGACTYLLSAVSSKATPDYTLLISFEKESSGNLTISRLVLRMLSLEVSIDPETLWKIQVNKEERSVPFDNGELKTYQDGTRLIIKTRSGLEISLSSTQYLRLTVPQVYDGTASGLCGNFNGDKYDDMELRNGRLTSSFAELLQSWAELAPGEHCTDTCGRECNECSLSPHDSKVCDVLLVISVEFSQCWNSIVEREIYTQMCIRAVCAGAGDRAPCLVLEAFFSACQAKGIPVGPWRENTPCTLQCPDRSSPSDCVEPSSSSCPALLQPGSPATRCSEGCQCHHHNVFDGGECVPYSQCGCLLGDKYITADELLYTEDCTQRCWCHPLSGALCEDAGCDSGQQCALRNGSWSCQDIPEVCELRNSLQVSTLSGQQLILEPSIAYSLMSLCDEASAQWFSVMSYYGPCNGSSRPVSVFQILLHGSSITIQDGTAKVNGQFVSLPHILPFGVSLTSGVSQDKSEVTVILRRDAGMEKELDVEIGITMVAIKAPLWYSEKLCGLCGNLNDLHSHSSVRSWALSDFPGCGFTG
ncbi:IgGFc-binding protein [Tautogolabrus adspersus]